MIKSKIWAEGRVCIKNENYRNNQRKDQKAERNQIIINNIDLADLIKNEFVTLLLWLWITCIIQWNVKSYSQFTCQFQKAKSPCIVVFQLK